MLIHWHEGLFLLPHHLQIFQRQTFESIAAERALSFPYPYGSISFEIYEEDLLNNRIRFKSLYCTFPGGRRLRFPEAGEIPSRDFQKELQEQGSITVCIAMPIWSENRANCVLEGSAMGERAKLIFLLKEEEVADENTGGNRKAVMMRQLNARILLGGEDRSDLEVLPLFRVVRDSGEELGKPKIDVSFAGPCLLLSGSKVLRELIRGICGQIEASRQELAIQINRGGFSIETMRGSQFEQVLRLQSLNRAMSKLQLLIDAPAATPFEVYREVLELFGELSALHPEREVFDFPAYNHDEPMLCFQEVIEKIRMILRGAIHPNFLRLRFVQKDGFLTLDLKDHDLSQPSDFFLGIATKEDPISLSRLVQNEDRFKLTPPSFANRAVRGILLQEERFPPLELPAQNGLYYYRLRRTESQQVWDLVQQEKGLVVRWSGHDGADYQISLFLTLPQNQ